MSAKNTRQRVGTVVAVLGTVFALLAAGCAAQRTPNVEVPGNPVPAAAVG
ncbi:hypothetical protein [Mycobacterium riyadhense]|uniref:Uncharacterized protein n=1 Tax=Mycobacterium riyadhense TaxID=486698 RepID=A0A653EK51_9MYCO|nr:hypothetical protein [Mycobacterium riyadhense]MCV7145962.1 hypothetical protein [Mycobacterium riyadhense]VTO97903.1 hypothetical protein BIN_B_02288 [Mycobacterium riyadhense]